MKEKITLNSLKVLVIAFIACFASITLYGFNTNAAGAPDAIAYKDFDAVLCKEKVVSFYVSPMKQGAHAEVQFCNSNKKVLETIRFGTFFTTFGDLKIYQKFGRATSSVKWKKNQLYYYRVRPFKIKSNGARVYGRWTKYKAFSTIYIKMKQTNERNRLHSITFKCPKKLPKAVKSLNIIMSTSNSDETFKRVVSLKRGQTKKLKKFNGKKFEAHKTYYARIVPVLKDGVACHSFVYPGYAWWSR